MPIVRRLRADEWRAYRDIRLRALAESPHAFGSVFEVERQRPAEHWAERLAAGAASEWQCPLVIEQGDGFVGLAWGTIQPDAPDTAHVIQMWVAPEMRGLGCGAMLLDAVVGWARKAGARTVALGVTCGDSPARRLYERAGFRPRESRSRSGPDRPCSPSRCALISDAASYRLSREARPWMISRSTVGCASRDELGSVILMEP